MQSVNLFFCNVLHRSVILLTGGGCLPLVHPLGQTPPPETATAVGGTHPTGLLSKWFLTFKYVVSNFIAGSTLYRSVLVNFTVSFPVDTCCPLVILFPTSGSKWHANKTCVVNHQNCEYFTTSTFGLDLLSEYLKSSLSRNEREQCVPFNTRMHSNRMHTACCSGRLSCHACPLPHMPPPAMHASPLPRMPPVMHAALWTDRHLWKHYLHKLRLRVVTSLRLFGKAAQRLVELGDLLSAVERPALAGAAQDCITPHGMAFTLACVSYFSPQCAYTCTCGRKNFFVIYKWKRVLGDF